MNGATAALSLLRRCHVVLPAVAALLLGSCIPDPKVPDCSRFEAMSLGPENEFRISIAADLAPTLDKETDRLDLAFTILPPVSGPLILTQRVDGQEVRRWSLNVQAGPSPATRCSLGATPILTGCGGTLGALPLDPRGQWQLDIGDNRVLEAGIALRTCR